jgi:type II secretion system protein G
MRKRGFTLIELLVVISIIGLLAALIVVNFNAARERARDVQRKSDLDQVKKALRMYYNDNNFYPTDDVLTWGSPFQSTDGNMVYMKLLPQDPANQGALPTYQYNQKSEGQDFCLWATLENKSDTDIAKSQARCSDCSVGEDDYVVCAD